MCVVSMIGDSFGERFRQRPYVQPVPNTTTFQIVGISREEFDALKREVESLRDLLVRAKKYDEDNGEPDCEIEDKVALLRAVAAAVGVNLDDVLAAPVKDGD